MGFELQSSQDSEKRSKPTTVNFQDLYNVYKEEEKKKRKRFPSAPHHQIMTSYQVRITQKGSKRVITLKNEVKFYVTV